MSNLLLQVNSLADLAVLDQPRSAGSTPPFFARARPRPPARLLSRLFCELHSSGNGIRAIYPGRFEQTAFALTAWVRAVCPC